MLLTASEISSDRLVVLSEGSAKAGTYRSGLSAAGRDETVEISRALEPGQEVEITQGPFQGLKPLVTRIISARERIEILIEWMGRTLHAEAGVTDLEPIGGPMLAKAAVTVTQRSS